MKTDHEALKWLQKQPNLSRRQAGWVEKLQSYDMLIEYLPGKANAVADVLSRRPDYFPNCPRCQRTLNLGGNSIQDDDGGTVRRFNNLERRALILDKNRRALILAEDSLQRTGTPVPAQKTNPEASALMQPTAGRALTQPDPETCALMQSSTVGYPETCALIQTSTVGKMNPETCTLMQASTVDVSSSIEIKTTMVDLIKRSYSDEELEFARERLEGKMVHRRWNCVLWNTSFRTRDPARDVDLQRPRPRDSPFRDKTDDRQTC